MSSSNIRRSSRRVKKPTYVVGDLVEITEKSTDRVLQGRLLEKVKSTLSSPHWIVSIEGLEDTEASESAFGRVLTDSVEGTTTTTATTKRKVSVTPEQELSPLSGGKKRKLATSTTSPPDTSSAADDQDPQKKTAAAQARQERFKRRSASTVGKQQQKSGGGRRNESSSASTKRKVSTEDVVRVPMLTGTLIIYRGAKRGAEFIRRV